LTSPIERLPSPAGVGPTFHGKISLCARLRTPETPFNFAQNSIWQVYFTSAKQKTCYMDCG